MPKIADFGVLVSNSGGQPLEFILAVPGRRYGEFVDTLADFQASAQAAEHEVTGETRWQGMRLVMAHQPYQAKEQTQLRRERIAKLKARADLLAGKLDGQDAGQIKRGRKLSDSGAKARFYATPIWHASSRSTSRVICSRTRLTRRPRRKPS